MFCLSAPHQVLLFLISYGFYDGFPGLQRCGKSCRLRWINYLRPDLKRGAFTGQEEKLIVELHEILGNRWIVSFMNKISLCHICQSL